MQVGKAGPALWGPSPAAGAPRHPRPPGTCTRGGRAAPPAVFSSGPGPGGASYCPPGPGAARPGAPVDGRQRPSWKLRPGSREAMEGPLPRPHRRSLTCEQTRSSSMCTDQAIYDASMGGLVSTGSACQVSAADRVASDTSGVLPASSLGMKTTESSQAHGACAATPPFTTSFPGAGPCPPCPLPLLWAFFPCCAVASLPSLCPSQPSTCVVVPWAPERACTGAWRAPVSSMKRPAIGNLWSGW